jgi:hypothetical protein
MEGARMREWTRVSLVDDAGKVKGSGTIHEIPRVKYTRGFMTTFADSRPLLVDALTHFELRVYARLEQRLEYGNWAPIIADEIAKDMNVAKTHVSTAIKGLMSKGVISRSPRELKIGRIWQYRLNADYGWKGNAIEWYHHQRERMNYGEVVQLFPIGSAAQKKSQGGDAIPLRSIRNNDHPTAADAHDIAPVSSVSDTAVAQDQSSERESIPNEQPVHLDRPELAAVRKDLKKEVVVNTKPTNTTQR